jgi:hypothetical protein
MWHYAAVLSTRRFLRFSIGQTILTLPVNSVPTQDQVLVPETLLKKRKSQEAARAVRREEAEKRKQVSLLLALRHP